MPTGLTPSPTFRPSVGRPHHPGMAVHKNLTYTSTQTGTDVWTPTAGKKIAVTSVVIGTYGTTAGRIILWFGPTADTTFTQDTDQVLFAGSFAPSSDRETRRDLHPGRTGVLHDGGHGTPCHHRRGDLVRPNRGRV